MASIASGVVFFLMSALAAANDGAVPQPSASPLKQIIEVRSRAVCQTLTERVEPAIVGLMKNNQIVEEGRRGLKKTAADATSHASQTIDFLALSNIALALNRNLATIDTILGNPAAFSPQPKTDDERTAADIKAKLLDLVQRQKLVVNALYGIVETRNMAEMQTEFGEHNLTSNPARQQFGPPFTLLLAQAGLQNPVTINPAQLMDQDLIGITIYDTLANLIAVHQRESASVENSAATAIASAVAGCRTASPSP
jgi:hypothetical protein